MISAAEGLERQRAKSDCWLLSASLRLSKGNWLLALSARQSYKHNNTLWYQTLSCVKVTKQEYGPEGTTHVTRGDLVVSEPKVWRYLPL